MVVGRICRTEYCRSVAAMKAQTLLPLLFQLLLLLSAQPSVTAIDFFYFILQWPGSYCDSTRGCCYPSSGKPTADFKIYALEPVYFNTTIQGYCDPSSTFDETQISDLESQLVDFWPSLECPDANSFGYWAYEWNRFGTCSASVYGGQHNYFKSAINMRKYLNLLKRLTHAGIKPDGGFYSKDRILEAIKRLTRTDVGIQCNVDESNNLQLYQIYVCLDNTGRYVVDCPFLPNWLESTCPSDMIEFPAF